MASVAGFLELSLGLSAWKVAGGNSWALRMNPSSGNLHPTECHLLLASSADRPAEISHYNAYYHALFKRATVPPALWRKTENHFGGPGFAVALASIFWRESWKYGERALRYTQHDVGHALAALVFSANLCGWQVTYLRDMSDRELERVLGLDQVSWRPDEHEVADLMVWVHGPDVESPPLGFSKDLVDAYANITFEGTPAPLSEETVHWKIIYETAEKLGKPPTQERWVPEVSLPYRRGAASPLAAAAIIRQRRSAQRFDSQISANVDTLLTMLDKTRPRPDAAPFDVGLGPPVIDLVLFVHNVKGLAPGLYFFRRTDGEEALRRSLKRREFEWRAVAGTMPLYLLKTGDLRDLAASISCYQNIAGDSAMSLVMLSRFDSALKGAPWKYKTLFWEAGMIGQVLYLEAEASGLRGTGIGCYFDDVVHELLGLRGSAYQSLYHFTIGVPLDDHRLTTLPAYHHLKRGHEPT
jgi:SagB-type dehydrogenase family enzyme